MSFYKSFFAFCFVTAVSQIEAKLNIDFNVNKNISMFFQTLIEEIRDNCYHELRNEINNSFSEKSSNDKEKEEFIRILADLQNQKYLHKHMTPTFMQYWYKASECYDSLFDNDVEILNNRKLELHEYYKTVNVDFDKIHKFYNCNLSKNEVFKVFICSCNKNLKQIAYCFGKNIIIRFGYAQLASDFCAISEQICHTMFRYMSSTTWNSIKNHLYYHKSKNAYVAYNFLDDVLAYSIGQLIVYEKLPNPKDSINLKPLDNRVYELSKKILPTLKKYLNNKQIIDLHFIDKFVNIIDKTYPKAYEDLTISMKTISLIVENGIDYTECSQMIKEHFKTKNISNELGSFATVFIGKNLGHPVLKNIQDQLPKKTSDYMFIKQIKGKLFFVFFTNDPKKIKKALNILKEQFPVLIGVIIDL